jgi:hypothetical protein
VTLAPRYWNELCADMVTQLLVLLSARSCSALRQLREPVRASWTGWCSDTRGLYVQKLCGWVLGYGRLSFERRGVVLWTVPISIGGHSRCEWLLLTRWLLPNRVHGLVQDELQGDTGFSVKLCRRLGPQCALCCARMRVRCTRLSIPNATRMYTRCANFQTTAVSWLQRKSWHCGDARVMDVLLGLLHCWRWSGEA